MAYPVRVIPDPRVGEDWRSTEARAVVLSPLLHHVASLFHGRPTCSKASNIIRRSVSLSPSVALFHPRHPSLCFIIAIRHSVSPSPSVTLFHPRHPSLCFILAIRHSVSSPPSVILFHPRHSSLGYTAPTSRACRELLRHGSVVNYTAINVMGLP